jgi:hypothetical protein
MFSLRLITRTLAPRHKYVRGMEAYVRHSWPRHLPELSGQFHDPANLSPGKEPPAPIRRRRCAPESVWELWRGEKSLAHAMKRVARCYDDSN